MFNECAQLGRVRSADHLARLGLARGRSDQPTLQRSPEPRTTASKRAVTERERVDGWVALGAGEGGESPEQLFHIHSHILRACTWLCCPYVRVKDGEDKLKEAPLIAVTGYFNTRPPPPQSRSRAGATVTIWSSHPTTTVHMPNTREPGVSCSASLIVSELFSSQHFFLSESSETVINLKKQIDTESAK